MPSCYDMVTWYTATTTQARMPIQNKNFKFNENAPSPLKLMHKFYILFLSGCNMNVFVSTYYQLLYIYEEGTLKYLHIGLRFIGNGKVLQMLHISFMIACMF